MKKYLITGCAGFIGSNFVYYMLEKYQDKVSWEEISGNGNIRWTIPMIQKFQKKLNWERFSEYADENRP